MAWAQSEIHTINGHLLDESVSALQKATWRGDEEAARYWDIELSESGFGAYCWRRLMVCALEDFDLADPQRVLSTVLGSICTKEITKGFDPRNAGMRLEPLGTVSLALSCAAKNWGGGDAICRMLEQRKRGLRLEVAEHVLDQHTGRGGRLGRGGQFWFAESSKVSRLVQIEGNVSGKKLKALTATPQGEIPPEE